VKFREFPVKFLALMTEFTHSRVTSEDSGMGFFYIRALSEKESSIIAANQLLRVGASLLPLRRVRSA
jgi:hypothetical protein